MKSTVAFTLSALFLLALPFSYCHDTLSCSTSPITAVDTAEYYRAFAEICGPANSYGYLAGCHAGDRGQECCYYVEAKYEGATGSKKHCWDAFDRILQRCVAEAEKTGGSYSAEDHGSASVAVESYFVKASKVCNE